MHKLFLVLFFLFFYNISFWYDNWTCEYKSEIDQCINANKTWIARTIEDFVCPDTKDKIKIVSQVILDLEFKKIDEKVEKYLASLEASKNKYFWELSSENFLKAIDEIENHFSIYWDSFWKEYYDLCNYWNDILLSKMMKCSLDPEGKSYYTYDEGKKFLWNNFSCNNLINTKLNIYKKISYDILQLNKHQIRNDNKKKFMQEERTKFDKLLEIIMVNISYMERIWKKWPSKNKHVHY